MKIEKRSKGYRIQPTINGKRYSITFNRKPTQIEIADEIRKIKDRVNGRVTFCEASEAYINARMNTCSPSTIKEYLGTLERLTEAFKEKSIDEITQNDVQKEINFLAATRSPKTVRNYHGFISAVLAEFRPQFVLKTKLPMNIRKEPYVPSKEDIDAILEVARDTQYEVPILLGLCSLRRGEICALDMSDIDFENHIVHITKDMVLNSSNEWVIKPPKTPTSVRDVPLPDVVIDAIKRNGLYKGHPNSITCWMRKTEEKLKIKHFSLHKTRHYFVSKAHDRNISDEIIMKAGGWSNPNVMIKNYRHAQGETQKAVNAVFEDLK